MVHRGRFLLLLGLSFPSGRVEAGEGIAWQADADFEVRLVDASHDLEPVRSGRLPITALRIRQALDGPSVLVLRLKKVTTAPASQCPG